MSPIAMKVTDNKIGGGSSDFRPNNNGIGSGSGG